MITALLYALASIGAAYIVGKSEISYPVRRGLVAIRLSWLVAMLECPVCFGFWFGLAAGWWLNPLAIGARPALATALVTAGMNLITARLGGLDVPTT